ncbi:carbamoyltransferase C-terminal domain-containing protein [Limnobacter sp.]|uniref:carbamoyltransferase C-terminal domain-containing protein n=1 Tax=Limnobacter sp. TaxID=2003368 RepID=UPI00311F460E
MAILGLSAGFHDAGATLISNQGKILFAGHAERYSGIKNDAQLNQALIDDALKYGEPHSVAWYERPWLKRTRQLYSGEWRKAIDFSNTPHKQVKRLLGRIPISYHNHHLSHAAAGFQTSPFTSAKVIVVDAIGEWDTISVWHADYEPQRLGKGIARYKKVWSQRYPHSIGLYYSAITKYVGLKPMEDEYILMGMAAYGKPYLSAYTENLRLVQDEHTCEFVDNLHAGLDDEYFAGTGLSEFDIASGAQKTVEQLLRNIWHKHCTFADNVVFMGGVALNCVANSMLSGHCRNLWIMPNPGDCGSSLGAAALAYGKQLNWQGPYLGHDMGGEYPIDPILGELMTNKIVGVATGRAEFGPRALGTRSLLADPRGADIKDRVNEIKRRQKFRPFAPMVLEEHAEEVFNMHGDTNPYMQGVYTVKQKELYPAICHADGTARVQTVGKQDHPGVRALLEKWYFMTGCPLLLNTSLNIKGEPMVNNRADADRFEQRYGVKVCS